MKELFDLVSRKCSEKVTTTYSTSFSSATKMLSPTIRQDIYNIYGFVRFADEIVDTFHQYDKSTLFNRFEKDLEYALTEKTTVNTPAINCGDHSTSFEAIEYTAQRQTDTLNAKHFTMLFVYFITKAINIPPDACKPIMHNTTELYPLKTLLSLKESISRIRTPDIANGRETTLS